MGPFCVLGVVPLRKLSPSNRTMDLAHYKLVFRIQRKWQQRQTSGQRPALLTAKLHVMTRIEFLNAI
jgi:hypothetical protein